MGFFGSVNQKNVNLKKAIVNYTKTNLSNASQVKNAMNKIIISWRNQTGATPSQAPLVTNSLMNRIRGGISRARRLRNKAFGLPKTPAVQQAINNTKQAEAAAIAGNINTARAKNNQAAAILNEPPPLPNRPTGPSKNALTIAGIRSKVGNNKQKIIEYILKNNSINQNSKNRLVNTIGVPESNNLIRKNKRQMPNNKGPLIGSFFNNAQKRINRTKTQNNTVNLNPGKMYNNQKRGFRQRLGNVGRGAVRGLGKAFSRGKNLLYE